MQNQEREEIPMEGSPTPLILLVCAIIIIGCSIMLFFDYQKNRKLIAEFEEKKRLVQQLRTKQVCNNIYIYIYI